MPQIDNIAITRSAGPQAQDLANLLQLLWQANGLAEKILANMNEMQDGSVYTALEAQYGLAAGKGATVYSLLFPIANGNPATPTGFGRGEFTQFMNRLNLA